MSDDKDDAKLIYLSQIRQQKGIPERHEQAAELIRSTGDSIIDQLGDKLIKTGRLDLVPRTLAYVTRGAWAHLNETQAGARSRLLERTVDFIMAHEVGQRVGRYERLMNSLDRQGFTSLTPFEMTLAIPGSSGAEDTVLAGAVAYSQRRFKALAVSTSHMTYLVCVDKMHGGLRDFHIREMSDPATGVAFNIQSSARLDSRAKMIKDGYLKHMALDGELSQAPGDRGYVCSVWSDAEVDGGWVTSDAFFHFNSLFLVTYLLDKVCEGMDKRNKVLLGGGDDGL